MADPAVASPSVPPDPNQIPAQGPAPWWDLLGRLQQTPTSDVPALSLLQYLGGSGFPRDSWVDRQARWFFTPHPHTPTTDKAEPKPVDELLPQPAAGTPGAPGTTTGFTIPGTGTGTYPDPPKPGAIPPTDFSKVRTLLDKAAPEVPTETREDRLKSIIGGLAAGMASPGAQKGIGSFLLNIGAGGLAGLAGEHADYKKAMQAYKDSLQSYREKQASTEMDIAQEGGKEAQAQRIQDTAYANDLWKYHQAQFASEQPRVLSTKNGVLTVEVRNPDGSIRIETTPIGSGNTSPTNKPYYVTPAGNFGADTTYGAAFAALGHWENTGRLHGTEGKGEPQRYLFHEDVYQAFNKQAQKTMLDERAANPSMTPAEQSQAYHAHLYELLFNYAQSQGKGDALLNLGIKFGTQKLNKEVTPPAGPSDTTDTTEQPDTGIGEG